jgi:hypothetical protein
MMTELCLYLNNWFFNNQPQFFGLFKIENGVLVSINDGDMGIKTGQYYRIEGSVFNNGVHKHGSELLVDESFDGSVRLMAVPKDVESLATEIATWQTMYGGAASENMSPFQSESLGPYSYSKGSVGSNSASSVPTWQSVYADRLRRYKKL